jgi:hypothetical protein
MRVPSANCFERFFGIFLQLFDKFGHFPATIFSRQKLFFGTELFGRKFGHPATVHMLQRSFGVDVMEHCT